MDSETERLRSELNEAQKPSPSLTGIETRTTRYRGEDGRERAVILWDDWVEIVAAERERDQLKRELQQANAEADKEHAKAVELSDKLIDWRKLAEELAGWVAECAKDYNDPHFTDRRQTGPCLLKALAHFNELKGKHQ